MKMKAYIIIAIIITSVLSACATANYGNKNLSDITLINKIQKGVTTKTDIENQFGKGELQIRNGKRMWVYTYIQEEIKALSSYANKREYWQLQCFFNQKGVVEDFNYYNEIR